MVDPLSARCRPSSKTRLATLWPRKWTFRPCMSPTPRWSARSGGQRSTVVAADEPRSRRRNAKLRRTPSFLCVRGTQFMVVRRDARGGRPRWVALEVQSACVRPVDPTHLANDPRNQVDTNLGRVSDHHGYQAVAVVLRAERVLDVAHHVAIRGRVRQQHHHRIGLFQGSSQLGAPVVAGHEIEVRGPHLQAVPLKRVGYPRRQPAVGMGIAEEHLHGCPASPASTCVPQA